MSEDRIVIPHRELSTTALTGLIQEFVTRDGTDSGYTRRSLDENVAMVRRQLDTGAAVIVYNGRTKNCNIVPAENFARSRSSGEEP